MVGRKSATAADQLGRQFLGLFCHLEAGQQFNVARRAVVPDEPRALAPLCCVVLAPLLLEFGACIVFITLARRSSSPWQTLSLLKTPQY